MQKNITLHFQLSILQHKISDYKTLLQKVKPTLGVFILVPVYTNTKIYSYATGVLLISYLEFFLKTSLLVVLKD